MKLSRQLATLSGTMVVANMSIEAGNPALSRLDAGKHSSLSLFEAFSVAQGELLLLRLASADAEAGSRSEKHFNRPVLMAGF